MNRSLSLIFLVLSTCGLLLAEDRQARVIKYSNKDVIELRCQMRVSTAIVLPSGEQILDFTTGDKDHWIVNGAQNFCYVHPAKQGATSNLNLICSSGNIYSFALTEVSGSAAEVDYKVFVEPRDQSLINALSSSKPSFVPAEELAHYKAKVTTLEEQIAKTQSEAARSAESQINEYRSKYPSSLKFQYRYKNQEPFQVTAIFHDDAFTYIRSTAREKPAIYEIKDGKPNLINFQLENGCYIVPKVIDRGYLQVGKKKMEFWR
jgi:type IV secretory pathway VirB9-like protein